MSLALLRDLAIVILAVLAIVQLLLLLTVTVLLWRKVSPVLDSAKATMDNVQGTSAFIAETTVHPVIRVISFITGVRKATGAMARLIKRKGS
ncbi:MAG: hypothetical protein HYY02_03975 [Chloroflexi bacterium]|nr:hypothetical protein [Chloroflexota bacterium]